MKTHNSGKMNTDARIRQFVRACRPPVTDSAEFMEEFTRQADLLPVPASMTREENLKKTEQLCRLGAILSRGKKRNIAEGVAVAVAGIAVSILVFAAVTMFPSAWTEAESRLGIMYDSIAGTFRNFPLLLSCFLAVAVIAVSFRYVKGPGKDCR